MPIRAGDTNPPILPIGAKLSGADHAAERFRTTLDESCKGGDIVPVLRIDPFGETGFPFALANLQPLVPEAVKFAEWYPVVLAAPASFRTWQVEAQYGATGQRRRAVPDPLARQEDRQLAVQLQLAHLERRRVAVAHQVADQPAILVHALRAPAVGHARRLHDGAVVAHVVDHAYEAVVEHRPDLVQDLLERRHRRAPGLVPSATRRRDLRLLLRRRPHGACLAGWPEGGNRSRGDGDGYPSVLDVRADAFDQLIGECRIALLSQVDLSVVDPQELCEP